ncbi:hypothetical protein BDV25DRAFT_138947 [Aspergillus avenaceus]|uniref:Uncharacterized protein n=1 Tax=Aspergillus avenaceus TaxID=36643 RepID=A0A5N6TZ05_ASPAV|nr:hypothetical protein BDV25DRAFT_138947 [Aspergillus avenaceus]
MAVGNILACVQITLPGLLCHNTLHINFCRQKLQNRGSKQLRKFKGKKWWDEQSDVYSDKEEAKRFVAQKVGGLDFYDEIEAKVEGLEASMKDGEMEPEKFIDTVRSLLEPTGWVG